MTEKKTDSLPPDEHRDAVEAMRAKLERGEGTPAFPETYVASGGKSPPPPPPPPAAN